MFSSDLVLVLGLSAFLFLFFFFFNDTATTEIYTLSLHDALPIFCPKQPLRRGFHPSRPQALSMPPVCNRRLSRSEEHTSELQSQSNLVCRLLLEKKNNLRSTDLLIIYFTTYQLQMTHISIPLAPC